MTFLATPNVPDGMVVAMRVFDEAFIYFDIAFLVVLIGLLLWQKKYMTLLVGALAGVLYMVVDYGIFYHAFQERIILFNGDMANKQLFFWILCWMSLSYGFTNFVWIWLWISKDKHLFEWSLLILCWWVTGPMLADKFSAGGEIITFRTTGTTHGGMAIMLFVGYLMLIIWNLKNNNNGKINIPWLLIIGILVQFGWEFTLLIGGIRNPSSTMPFSQKLKTLIVNSLVETNLGMPYVYLLFIVYSSKFTERLKRRKAPLKFLDRIYENNREKVKNDFYSEFLAG